MAKNADLQNSLDKLAKNNSTKRVRFAPDIPEKQLKNATASLEIPSGSNILVLVDDTFTKSGKGGICVTNDAIYWKAFSIKGNAKFDDVKQFEANLGFSMNLKINGEKIPLGYFSKEEITPFADFLLEVLGLEQTEAEAPVETPTKEPTQAFTEKETEAQKTLAESFIRELEDPHTDGNTCLGAVNELGQIGTERAIRALVKAFPLGVNQIRGRKDLIGIMEVSVNMAIHYALQRIDKSVLGEAIVRALSSEGKDEANGAAYAAASFGIKDSRAIEPLIAAINGKGFYSSDYAACALESIGEPAVERLTEALKDESKKDVHERIQQILKKIQQKRYKGKFSKPDAAK